MLEPLGIRFLGVEFREVHLESMLRAWNETLRENPDFKNDAGQVEKLFEATLKFGDLVIEKELFMDSDPATLKELFLESGLSAFGSVFERLLKNMARRKSLLNLFSTLSSVTVEGGSISIRFRNKANRIEKLSINLRRIWKEIRRHSKEIENSFRHVLEIALSEIRHVILCVGTYAAAFVLAILSLWYSVAFSIGSGLSTIAQNTLNSLKASFPILSFIIWIICILYSVAGGIPKAKEAYEAMKHFLE